ncbi:MAG: type II toxin-antitoxin system VapC family toxin [Candidatus Sumerlaeia bacterium]|nr:type II toxin-antitoxin system VapC family toxin [Candidatus Sumerlaeia bacterium]
MVFDTDVLIWCLRGNVRAGQAIQRDPSRALSIVSYMELLQGAKNRRELGLIRAFLKDLGFAMLPLTEAIGHRAAVYMEEYTLKGALSMPDALVAATVVDADETLCTANTKHFKIVAELSVKPFRPE